MSNYNYSLGKDTLKLSSMLFHHQNITRQFFDTALLDCLNRTIGHMKMLSTLTIFTPASFNFHSLLWKDKEELDPPYKDFIKKDRFKQYIEDEISHHSEKRGLKVFRGSDFFSVENYESEPYIQFLEYFYHAIGIKYCLKIPLGKGKNYWLNIFKDGKSGDFSDREIDYCKGICHLLSSAYNAFQERMLMSPSPKTFSDHVPVPAPFPVSSREMEIVDGIAEGLSYKELSEKLFISISTVRNHMGNIYKKLGISNQRQLVKMYFKYRAGERD